MRRWILNLGGAANIDQRAIRQVSRSSQSEPKIARLSCLGIGEVPAADRALGFFMGRLGEGAGCGSFAGAILIDFIRLDIKLVVTEYEPR